MNREPTLTTEQALAWFGEPRYSVTDLQRAYAEGAAAVLSSRESVLREALGWLGDLIADVGQDPIEGWLHLTPTDVSRLAAYVAALAATPPAAVLLQPGSAAHSRGPADPPHTDPIEFCGACGNREPAAARAALPAGSGAGELDAAWREAEAALVGHKIYELRVGRWSPGDPPGYWADGWHVDMQGASPSDMRGITTSGPTPVAALRALTARLRERAATGSGE